MRKNLDTLEIKSPKIILDFHNNRYITVSSKQYDKDSRSIPIQLTDNGVPVVLNSNFKVQLKLLTPDNRAILENIPIQEDGTLLIKLTESMLHANGKAEAEINVYDIQQEGESKLLSTMNFNIAINESPYEDDRIIDSDEFNALTELLEKAEKDYTYVMETAQASADAAKVSEDNAAASASVAKESENNAKNYATVSSNSASKAKTSETNAKASELASAESETNASTSATNASNSASASATSAGRAATSETNAKTSETNAATSASNAKTSETNAKTSEMNASESATTASNKASAAATSETNAKNYASNASAKASEASVSASTATTKASEASTSAANAKTSETNAKVSENIASTKASEASESATIASSKATASATSEQNAKNYASNAKTSETNAKTSEMNAKDSEVAAKTSETNASESEDNALTYSNNAKTSATNASISESNALTYSNNAKTSASNAKTSELASAESESIASEKATEATNSATASANSAIESATSARNSKASETNAKTSEANALASAMNAEDSASEAKISETNAKTSEENAKDSENASATSEANAKKSADAANVSEINAQISEVNAKVSENSASASANTASSKATESANSASASANSASAAKTSETNSKTSETNASISEEKAKESEIAASESADLAGEKATASATSATESAESASKAKTSETNAKTSETNASTSADVSSSKAIESGNYATASANSASAAKTSEINAKESELSALESENNASISASNAEKSATDASNSATNANESEINASESATIASNKANDASTSASNASKSESNAKTSETNAKTSETNASSSANIASTKANEASNSATNAASSATTASTKATEAANSATSAANSATIATNKANEITEYADISKSYAVGTDGTVRDNDDTDNAQYYYEQAKRVAQSLNGLVPMGTITFAELSNVDNQQPRYMFNISNSFTTDATFKEGAGHLYGAGTNVYRTEDGYWDALVGSTVTGIKGANESNYRQGNVNITLDNLGVTATAAELNKLDGVTATTEELNYVDGVTSNIQTQLNAKQPLGSTTFALNSTDGYVAVRTPGRAANQYYEFWDSDVNWAGIAAGKITANNGFVGNLTGNADTATNATTSTNVKATEGTNNVSRHVWFSDSSTETMRAYDDDFKYNPTTNVLTVGSISGSAAKLTTARTLSWTGDATGSLSFDGSANKSAALTLANSGATAGSYGVSSATTLAHSGSFNVPYVTVDAKGRVTSIKNVAVTLPASGNTDTKVSQTRSTVSNYRPLLLHNKYASAGTDPGAASDVVHYNESIAACPSTGDLRATTFTGSLKGNADTATKATQDSAGQQINTTYIKGLSISGKTITYTKGDGTTGTLTTQDTNTTYSLSSFGITATATELNYTDGVTSNIQTQLNGKAASSHTHSYLPLSGGTLTGALTGTYATLTGTLTANSNTKTPFYINGNLPFINKKVTWDVNSYIQHVILLIPVPTSTNWSGMNYFDGKFLLWKTGGNVYDVVEVNLNCVYNTLRYHLEVYGDHGYGGSWKLCVCKYNNVLYYALKCPYHSNPYTNVEFTGHVSSTLTGGTSTVELPLDIAYYNENTSTILNSEVKNSLTETLTTSVITSASSSALCSHGGFIGSLSGNASTASKLSTARTISLTGSVTGSGSFDGSGNLSIATTTNHTHSYLPLSGGTLTGGLKLASSLYFSEGKYGLECNNSDITGINGLYFSDACDTYTEGIHFYSASDVWDTLYAKSGVLYFHPSKATDANVAGNVVLHAGNYTSYAATANHTHSVYYDSSISRTANTVLAAPNGSAGSATFRKLVVADLPTGTTASTVALGNHTHNYAGSSSAGGDATNALKLSGYSASSSASNSTIALRNGSGYLYATYFNQSSSAETPTTSSYIVYANSDGFFRKSSLANIKTILGLGSAAYTASTAYAASSHTHSYLPLTGGTLSSDLTVDGKLKAYSITSQHYVAKMKVSTAAWYRIYTSTNGNASGLGTCIFTLGRNYNSPQNEDYSFAVSVGYDGQINITQLSGCIGGHLITKIRVVYKNSSTFYIDFYSTTSSYENSYFVYGIGCGSFQNPTVVSSVASDYKTYEFTTVNGCKSDKGFTGSLSGNASSATKLGTDAGSATQPVYFSGGKPVACTYTLGKSVPSDAKFTDTTYSAATTSALGLVKIGSNITVSSGTISLTKANVTAALGYTPPTSDTNTTYSQATSSALGLVKIGYSASGKNYAVQLNDSGQMYVNVPWTDNNTTYTSLKNPNAITIQGNGTTSFTYDGSAAKTLNIKPGSNVSVSSDTSGNITIAATNTTYSNMTAATSSAAGKAGLVPAPAAGKQASFLRGDGTWAVPTNTTYSAATTSAAGLMSAADKTKLDGITSSADSVSFTQSLTSGTKVGTITINGSATDLYAPTTSSSTDTKNTAGSTNSSSKLYLIGATSQATNPQTYSHDTAYVGTDGCLYSNSTKVSVEGHTHSGYASSSHTHSEYASSSHTHSTYAPIASPAFTGSISMGRKSSTTVGTNSVALGASSTASGNYSCAIGYNVSATAVSSFSFGNGNTVSGARSLALGMSNTITGQESFAAGLGLTLSDSQAAVGFFNTSNSSAIFMVGNGSGSSSTSNAFRVNYDGKIYAQSSSVSTGADYAEYFEWSDSNPNKEDRVGHFVTFDENDPEKIRFANGDDYILGIVSGLPSVIGNGDECWRNRYIMDDFGRFIEEEYEYTREEIDEETGETILITKTRTRYKENPEYNSELEYSSRAERPEWDAIGMIGVLSVRDDGTCKVNGYCKCIDGGIATASETGYRVIKRVSDNVVKVVLK